jgi:endonuclease/exonuclease/phosphatase family metal-dependent hydrolase
MERGPVQADACPHVHTHVPALRSGEFCDRLAGGSTMLVVGTWNLENLYRPGGEYGPSDDETYAAKLKGLADTVNGLLPDLLGVQEVGEPEALGDLLDLLDGDWHVALSTLPDRRGIRVGFVSRHPMTVVADSAAFPAALAPLQADDSAGVTTRMGRGLLVVRIEPTPTVAVDAIVCHLKSKLLTYPDGRFSPHDEGERARYSAYALYRRAAEAVTVRSMADQDLDGHGQDRAVVVLGDLNDEPQAASTQILLGPPGSELGTAGADRPDKGDAFRLWNLASLIPEDRRYSRVYRGRKELIDHILVSHALRDRVQEVRSVIDHPLPSVTDTPGERRDAVDSDHAPVLARIDL